MSTNSKRCWDKKTSKRSDKKSYFVNTESGVSQWGKQDSVDPLPAGWEYCISKSGQRFYYNLYYNRAQWEKPTEKDKLAVPEGFEEKRSTKCKNVYYVNSKTGKPQWEYPIEKETRGSEDLLDYESETQSINDYHPDPYLNQELDLRTQEVMAKLDDENRTSSRQKSITQKFKEKRIQKRTPTRNNHKKMIEKNKKLHNLLSLLTEERSLDTEEFKKLSDEIHKTKQEIRSLSNELDEEFNPPFKFNREIDEEFYDARRFFQKDRQTKRDEEDEFYDANYESGDEFHDANEKPDHHLLANRLLEEDRRNPIVDQYTEIKPIPKDEHGIGLPYPRQYHRSLSRESLAKKHTSVERGKEIQNIISRIPTMTLPPSESDQESDPESDFEDAVSDQESDFKDSYDFDPTERNQTFGEYSEYNESKIPYGRPHRARLGKSVQHRNNVRRLTLHPYR